MLIVSPNLKLPSEVVEVNEVMVGAVVSIVTTRLKLASESVNVPSLTFIAISLVVPT